MSLDVVSEVWDALKSHIYNNERSEAADTLVNLLVDMDYDADEIRDEFRRDSDIMTALKSYLDQHEIEEEDYDDYEDDEDEDDEW